jgi:DNA topoisomerase-1
LVEKTLKSGVYLSCPNNRKQAAEEEPVKKRKGKAAEEPANVVTCSFSKKIAEAPAEPAPPARYQTKPEPIPVG